jgi:hypothetical protein
VGINADENVATLHRLIAVVHNDKLAYLASTSTA